MLQQVSRTTATISCNYYYYYYYFIIIVIIIILIIINIIFCVCLFQFVDSKTSSNIVTKNEFNLLSSKVASLYMIKTNKGVTTEAEWIEELTEKKVLSDSPDLTATMESFQVEWWINNEKNPNFPKENDKEAATCQPFVTKIIKAVQKLKMLPYDIVDCHDKVSFQNRRPDTVVYNENLRGASQIVAIGDVKGCSNCNTPFPRAEVGHILDMARVLMVKEQFTRQFLYCFLTDGFNFQFFKCFRNNSKSDEELFYEESIPIVGMKGWQVRN